MCVPLAAAALIFTAVGGAYGAYAQHQQGVTEQKIANYNAGVQENQAKAAEDIGNIQEQQQRTKMRQVLASQDAAAAASGADVNSGSFMDLADTTIYNGEQDAMMIRANAAKQAWGYRTGADVTRMQGAAAKTAGNNAAFGTLLTTAGRTFGMASSNQQAYGHWYGK